jgi:hypothetical protein
MSGAPGTLFVVDTFVFLDSRDLINCIEHARPLDHVSFAKYLRSRNAAVILTMMNVLETIPRGRPIADIVELARRLETLPHVFVRYSEISTHEFDDAVEAFNNGRACSASLRFCRSFWRVLIPAAIADDPSQNESHGALDRLPMSEQLRLAFPRGRELGSSDDFDPNTAAELATILTTHRDILGVHPPSKALFRHAVATQLSTFDLNVTDVTRFADWLFRSPMVCPAWRLGHEVFQEMRLDQTARINGNGVTDLTHVYFVPYAAAATLDKQWRNYCDRVVSRLTKIGIDVPYGRNVYSDIGELVRNWR